MSSCFDEIRRVVNDLKVDKDQAVCENQELEDDLSQVKESICEMEAVNDKLIEKLECCDQTERKLKDESDKMKSGIDLKNQEICCLQKQSDKCEELKNAIRQLKCKLDCANERNCKLEQLLTELEMYLREKNNCLCLLDHKATDLECEVTKMKSSIKYLTNENGRLQGDIGNCKCDFQKANQDLECLRCKQKLCDSAKHKLQALVESTEITFDRTCETLQREKTLGTELRAQIKTCQDENRKLNMDNLNFHQENRNLIGKISASNKELRKCQREYHQAQCEYEEIKKEVEKFKTQVVSNMECNILT